MSGADYERIPPTCALRYAAELELFKPRQGEGNFERTPLELEVSLGEQLFTGDTNRGLIGFKLRFRRVILEVLVKNGQISRDDRYQRTLSQEEFSQYLKRVSESTQVAEGSLEGGVSGPLSKILSAIGVDVSAHAKVAGDIKRGRSSAIESSVSLKIVRWIGTGRWEIGHEELGDPGEIDGLLKGAYLSYPGDGRSREDYNPLCYVEPHGNRYSVGVELRARLADCVYIPEGLMKEEPSWSRKNRQIIEARLVQKMLQEQNERDGLDPPEGEVVLARGGLLIKKTRRSE